MKLWARRSPAPNGKKRKVEETGDNEGNEEQGKSLDDSKVNALLGKLFAPLVLTCALLVFS